MPTTMEDLPTLPALCRFALSDDLPRLGWLDGTTAHDLSGSFTSLFELLQATAINAGIVDLVSGILAESPSYPVSEITLLAPIDLQEVWAAGVTYERSREARMSESEHAADVYWSVYNAERPELFFKGDARRVRGPGAAIRARGDATWTVPEPELTLVLNPALQVVGFTIGNDVSSRDIEGANPLYLPQAKVYAGAAALGPVIVPVESVADPLSLSIRCSIERAGAVIWQDETTTAKLHRRFDELTSYLGREDSFPFGAFLMTGTCLVPPDSISLQSGDVVSIAIDGLGVLRNPVA